MRSENGKLESTDIRVPTSHHNTNEKATHTTVYELILRRKYAARIENQESSYIYTSITTQGLLN